MLFQADPKSKQVAAIAPSSFTGLGIWERRDLQEWVVREPRLLDEPLLVITTEFDRFDGSKDRLDVLAVDERSNLVVVELKRDQAAGHADLQALRYAAMVSSMTLEDVSREHAAFSAKTGTPIPQDKARGIILDFMGITGPEERESFAFGDRPRIVLASENFAPEITTTVLWLRDQFSVDIKCVRLTPYSLNGSTVITSQTIIPLHEACEYQVGLRRKEAEREEAEKRARKGNTTAYLLEHGLLRPGQKLLLRRNLPDYLKPVSGDARFEAEVVGESTKRFLRWSKDGQVYSISGLTHEILKMEHPHQVPPGSVNGNTFWVVAESGPTLWELMLQHSGQAE